jgi:hypothetical protein
MDRPAHGGSNWYEWAHDWLHFVGRSQYSLQIIIPTRMYSDLPSNSQNTCTGPPMCVSGFYELAAAVASSSHLFHPTCNANVQYIYCVCMVILYIWHRRAREVCEFPSLYAHRSCRVHFRLMVLPPYIR